MNDTMYYYVDNEGYYSYKLPANGAGLPLHATDIEPELHDGYIPHLDGGVWTQIENHKGKSGYIDGQLTTIKEYGPLPAGWSDTPPTPTQGEILAAAKAKRAAAVAAIIVTVDGMVFDGDETSQERMARTITTATSTGVSMTATTLWVLHDNTVAYPTIGQLAQALRMAGEAQTAVWAAPYGEFAS